MWYDTTPGYPTDKRHNKVLGIAFLYADTSRGKQATRVTSLTGHLQYKGTTASS